MKSPNNIELNKELVGVVDLAMTRESYLKDRGEQKTDLLELLEVELVIGQESVANTTKEEVDQNWKTKAECIGKSSVMFRISQTEAIKLCGKCIVRDECLDYALSLNPNQTVGVWGGTTQKDRKRILRERKSDLKK